MFSAIKDERSKELSQGETGELVLRRILCIVANFSTKYRNFLHCTVLSLNIIFQDRWKVKVRR